MTVVRMKSIDQHGLEDIGKFSSLRGGLTSNVEQVCIYGQGRSSYLCIRKSVQSFLSAKHPCIFPFTYSLYKNDRICRCRGTPGAFLWSTGWAGQRDCKDRVKFLEQEYSV